MRCAIRSALLIGLIILPLSSCQPASIPTPAITPQRVGVTPRYLGWVSESLVTYRSTHPEANFILETYSLNSGLSAIEEGGIDLLIGVAEPEGSLFATPIFRDGIAVIHHPELDIRDLTLEELRQIFSGQAQNWKNFDGEDLQIYPTLPLPGDDLRELFQARVMGNFQFSSLARLQSSTEDTINLIKTQPGAIGVIPFSQLDDTSEIFRIEGHLPSKRSMSESRYPLSYWVVAVAREEPVGPVREWLSWVQFQYE